MRKYFTFVNALLLVVLFLIVVLISKGYINREKSNNEVSVALQSNHTNEYILYYDTGEGFSEQKTVSIMLEGSEEKSILKFALPEAAKNIQNLRFDLGESPEVDIVIYSIKYKNKSLLSNLKSSNMVEIEPSKSSLRIKTTGIDPYVHLGDISEFLNQDDFTVEIMIYVFSFLISLVIVWLLIDLDLVGSHKRFRFNINVLQSVSLLLIFLPLLTKVFFSANIASSENRNLASKPTTSITNYKQFTKEYESYFNDNFGLRSELVKLNSNIKYHILSKSTHPNVVIGKKSWLFYSAEKSVEDYQGMVRFTDAELERIASNLQEANNASEASGAQFIFIVGPNKQTIYPEYMPSKYVRFQNETRYDQLLEYLRAHSKINIVDVRDTLIRGKDDFQTYYATDTHWNDFGGYLAYDKLMNALPAYHPHSREDFSISTVSYKMQLDLALMLSMKLDDTIVSLVPQFNRTSNVIQSDNYLTSYLNESQGGKLLMYRDSFGAAMMPYLADHFKSSIFLTDFKVEKSKIAEEKPSIIVLEIVERNLPLLLY